jgi:hypothetical protein
MANQSREAELEAEADAAARARAESLARRYLDLWQDEMTALSADPASGHASEQIVDSCINLSQAGLAWTESVIEMTRQGVAATASQTGPDFLAQGRQLSEQWQNFLRLATSAGGAGPGTAADRGAGGDAAAPPAAGAQPARRKGQQEPAGEQHGAGQAKRAGAAGKATGQGGDADPAGTAPAAAASQRRRRDLDELTRRLAVLEARLAAYESGLEEPGGGAGGGTANPAGRAV